MQRPFLAILTLFVSAALPLSAFAANETVTHPDGSVQFRVPLNAKGERHGTYTAYYPGGRKIQERAKYENGKLTGIRELYDEKGKVVTEEAWVAGRLVAPKSPKLIEAARQQILKESAQSVLRTLNGGKPTDTRAPDREALARALAKVNTYRYLADLPYDVTLDDDYVNLCQYASELLVKHGQLSHNPPRPSGMDDEAYKLGKDGCGRSNLYSGGDVPSSVDAYMNDSDPSNIDRLGHRRWVLNPAMAKTGFGGAAKFSAMYSFDGSREEKPDYEYVSYPPRGYTPMNMFSPNWAWHVSVNPKKYKVTDAAAIAIYVVDAKLKRSDKPLDLDYQKVNRDGFGVSNAIIARPKGFSLRPNMVFEVVISGVETKDGQPAELSHFVSFY